MSKPFFIWPTRFLTRRLFRVAVVLLLCSPLFAAVAWLQRLRVVSALGRFGTGLKLTLGDMQLDWNGGLITGDRLDNVTLLLSDLTVYSPREKAGIIAIQNMTIRLQRTAATTFSFRGIGSVNGLDFNFIAYDPTLADTNVRRLVYALGGSSDDADSVLDTSEDTLPEDTEPATSSSPPAVTFTRVTLRRIAIHPSIRASPRARASRVTLPSVTLLDETLSLRMLKNGLSVGLLNWLSSLVIRTLASTSIDAAASSLDGGVGLLAGAIQKAIDVVDYTNQVAALPGAPVLAGATRAARRLVRGLRVATLDVLGGVKRAGSAVVSGVSGAFSFMTSPMFMIMGLAVVGGGVYLALRR